MASAETASSHLSTFSSRDPKNRQDTECGLHTVTRHTVNYVHAFYTLYLSTPLLRGRMPRGVPMTRAERAAAGTLFDGFGAFRSAYIQ